MRTHSLIISATLFSALVLALAVIAMAADPHVGIWKLNVAKSKINSGPPDKSGMVTITAQDNGIRIVGDSVDAEGKAAHAEFAAKYDGKDVPFIGDPGVDTVSLQKIDANTWSEVLKKAGKEVVKGQNAISANGKTMTRTYKLKNDKGQEFTNTAVYDKQ
jgi:hypothetical protein